MCVCVWSSHLFGSASGIGSATFSFWRPIRPFSFAPPSSLTHHHNHHLLLLSFFTCFARSRRKTKIYLKYIFFTLDDSQSKSITFFMTCFTNLDDTFGRTVGRSFRAILSLSVSDFAFAPAVRWHCVNVFKLQLKKANRSRDSD